jgi:DNA-binding transcriptional MerR regulator
MSKELTIQQVAQSSGLSVHTLRYYERIGLLDPIERASSGHRRYTSADIEWLRFLVYLRATGMSIRQMQNCAELRRGGATTERERLAFLEEHRQRLQQQQRKLEDHLSYIDQKIAYLQAKLASEEVVTAS